MRTYDAINEIKRAITPSQKKRIRQLDRLRSTFTPLDEGMGRDAADKIIFEAEMALINADHLTAGCDKAKLVETSTIGVSHG